MVTTPVLVTMSTTSGQAADQLDVLTSRNPTVSDAT